jgi:hypothetical protein
LSLLTIPSSAGVQIHDHSVESYQGQGSLLCLQNKTTQLIFISMLDLKNVLSPNCFLFLFRENQQLLSVNVSKPSAMKTNEKKKLFTFMLLNSFLVGQNIFNK